METPVGAQHENVAVQSPEVQLISLGWAGLKAGEAAHRLSHYDHTLGHLHVSMNQMETELVLDAKLFNEALEPSNKYISHLRLVRIVRKRVVA
jgi:hypothetical protein